MAGEAVREVYLIPEAELATGQAAHIRNSLRNAVAEQVSGELNVPQSQLLVRDIRPKDDLDYTYTTWGEKTGTSSATYETMSSGTMADKRYMVIYGVMDTSASISITQIRIKVGNSIKAIWHLENLYSVNGDGARNGFCPGGVLIPQNTPYTIERYVVDIDSPAQIVLKGFVVEKVGKVLTP